MRRRPCAPLLIALQLAVPLARGAANPSHRELADGATPPSDPSECASTLWQPAPADCSAARAAAAGPTRHDGRSRAWLSAGTAARPHRAAERVTSGKGSE